MGFFTVGNLLTLGIVLLILILYRHMDRNNRNLKLLRDYSEKLKKELSSFVEEQERAVKDYGISLNVERDSARELMKRLQVTEEEMAEKAAAVARLDSQIKTYENSLAELDRMTNRVQENMNRVREESAFVDATGKRINETRVKLEELEKDLKDMEKQFERENSESLENTTQTVLAVVKSEVSDLRASAEIIERKVEDHRQEINKIEEDRKAGISRDLAHINSILSTAVEQAAKKADKMEDAALVRLKEQAEDRILKLKSSEEEQLKGYHENAKARVAEVQNLVKDIREHWRAERSDWESRDKLYQEGRKKEIHELTSRFNDAEKRLAGDLAALEKRMEELSARADETVASQQAMLKAAFTNSEKQFTAELEAMQKRMEELSARADETVASQQTMLKVAFTNSEKQFTAELEAMQKRMEELSARADEIVASQQTMLKAAFTNSEKQIAAELEAMQERMEELSVHAEETAASHKAVLKAAFSESEKNAAADIAALEKRMEELSIRAGGIVSSQEAALLALVSDSEKHITADLEATEKRMDELSANMDRIVSSQEAMLVKAAEEMKQKALEINEAKLEEYRSAQEQDFKRLETLADDSRNLDVELRRNMQGVIDRTREEFSRFENESAAVRKAEAGKFSTAAEALKEEMAELERDLAALKSAASDNVSEKLRLFEDAFIADLGSRSEDINRRLREWQENLDNRLLLIGEESRTSRLELERSLTEEMRKNLSAQDEKLVSELEHLRADTGAFEDGIRERMNSADESVTSFKEQLDNGFKEARKEADIAFRSEISKQSLASAEAIKQNQRELDGKLREISDYIQSRNVELSGIINASRSELDEARNGLEVKIRELDDTIEDARRRVRDLSAETDTRISSVRASVEDAERHIREAVDQTKLLDRADELRLEMERRIEDLNGDIDRLDQRRAEAFQLENDFIKIRRLEDDVNAKMTRFLSEKRRIETMEADFNRLLQISRSVEEKLTQVTSSDDTLQGLQLQIRRLEEALGSTEEKFQRMERKSQILDNTNDSIDRNFRTLQESEKMSVKIGGDLDRFSEDIEFIKTSIEKLAGESDKAREAVDRIDVLDNALEEIEERITSMQRARQWIAEMETRLEELNRQAQVQAKAIDSLVKGKKSTSNVDLGEGVPSQQKKENVVILARQGWPKDKIAKALKISLGEVELILEMAPKD